MATCNENGIRHATRGRNENRPNLKPCVDGISRCRPRPIQGVTHTLIVPERTMNFFFEGTRVEVGSVRGTDVPDLWLLAKAAWGTTLFSLRKGQFTQNCITMKYP
jgi:hypothetical protein